MSGLLAKTSSRPFCSSTTGEAPVLPVTCRRLPCGLPFFFVSAATTSRPTCAPVSTKSVVRVAIHWPLPGSPGRFRSTTISGTPALSARPGTGASGSNSIGATNQQHGLAGQQVLDIGELLGGIRIGVGPDEVVAGVLECLLHLARIHHAPLVLHARLRKGDEALAGGESGAAGRRKQQRGCCRYEFLEHIFLLGFGPADHRQDGVRSSRIRR